MEYIGMISKHQTSIKQQQQQPADDGNDEPPAMACSLLFHPGTFYFHFECCR